jgi:translation initiation factor IF-2
MSEKTEKALLLIPPVVSVLGHVDHGKTTLLDSIRKSNIAGREHGGITQKIGASSITVMHEGKKRMITFIDTPGHQAFSSMRNRGAHVADIALLIVSVVDGVMPQTKESIHLLQKDHIPFIVVLTKSDSPDKNPEKVKQQLIRENVLLEGYGGDIPCIEVSARTGHNIQKLLELILLVFEIKQPATPAKPTDPLEAIVIESKLDPKAGPKATLIVKKGTIMIKDEVITDTVSGKVRSLISDKGFFVQSASIGEAVEMLGFEKVPHVGSMVSYKGEKHIKSEEKKDKNMQDAEGKTLSLILVADTLGSLEAIIASLPKEVRLIEEKTGEVSEADVLFAKSTGAIILSFNVKLRGEVVKFAQTEKILLKNYAIIYEMFDEIQQVVEGKQLAMMEQIFGVGKIQATFPFDKMKILGVVVLDGRVARGDKIRIMQEERNIGESMIVSLRQGKEQVSKVEKGQECGILISPMLDITIGDMVVCHS